MFTTRSVWQEYLLGLIIIIISFTAHIGWRLGHIKVILAVARKRVQEIKKKEGVLAPRRAEAFNPPPRSSI